jgi:hypothetical protein
MTESEAAYKDKYGWVSRLSFNHDLLDSSSLRANAGGKKPKATVVKPGLQFHDSGLSSSSKACRAFLAGRFGGICDAGELRPAVQGKNSGRGAVAGVYAQLMCLPQGPAPLSASRHCPVPAPPLPALHCSLCDRPFLPAQPLHVPFCLLCRWLPSHRPEAWGYSAVRYGRRHMIPGPRIGGRAITAGGPRRRPE